MTTKISIHQGFPVIDVIGSYLKFQISANAKIAPAHRYNNMLLLLPACPANPWATRDILIPNKANVIPSMFKLELSCPMLTAGGGTELFKHRVMDGNTIIDITAIAMTEKVIITHLRHLIRLLASCSNSKYLSMNLPIKNISMTAIPPSAIKDIPDISFTSPMNNQHGLYYSIVGV